MAAEKQGADCVTFDDYGGQRGKIIESDGIWFAFQPR
jgi:hypothetical protein